MLDSIRSVTAKSIREASPASFVWNYAKTLAQTAAFWGLFLVLLPLATSWAERQIGLPQMTPKRSLAGVLFVLFGLVALSSAYTMARVGQGTPLPLDTARRLVVSGFYRYVRNPMAIAGLVQGIATGFWFGSYLVFATGRRPNQR